MNPQDIDTNSTGCCREQDIQSKKACCCGDQDNQQTGCCREQDDQPQAGCCREQDDQPQSACCREPHGEEYYGRSEDIEAVFNDDVQSLEHLQALLIAANDKYVRLYSEFENFKKRAAKEKMSLIDKANEQTLKELLPIIDDFERGMSVLRNEHDGTQDAMQTGVKLIYDKLCVLLKRFGVQEMVLEEGSAFDADLHEAVMQKLVENPEMKGRVIAVVEKGYLIKEYVLRFAKVIIGL
ncbi:nucleotide exchange factor GrpE [Cardinium endosymbiont of Tipula unca]|uniref:nucleotide exchange factor GrpE n=1 Tax=Cardinium endosymbiont of Tipula unca TaxID=3066216 RepID=UPI0030CFC380